jgi:hypothetical protein
LTNLFQAAPAYPAEITIPTSNPHTKDSKPGTPRIFKAICLFGEKGGKKIQSPMPPQPIRHIRRSIWRRIIAAARPKLAGNGANAMLLNPQDGDRFTLGKR